MTAINAICAILKGLNIDGDIVWQKKYVYNYWMTADDIMQTEDGGYIISGFLKSSFNDDSDFWLIKTDSSGN